MAYLAFAEPGMAGYARVEAVRRLTLVEDRPSLSELERSVIALARRDGPSSLRAPGVLSRLLEWVFGIKASTQLADPKLEALRRIAVLSWRRGYSVPSAEVRAFLASGYSPAEYELVVDGIAAAREAEAHRRA
ncbi:hypothetical protein ACU5AX_01190 [Sphingomonas sp. XXL09]|uniref:hypothetical protein n=1 Tax=Sphingomonas sp. XXL09 TaxID=3457787 RepID=UPI00406BA262